MKIKHITNEQINLVNGLEPWDQSDSREKWENIKNKIKQRKKTTGPVFVFATVCRWICPSTEWTSTFCRSASSCASRTSSSTYCGTVDVAPPSIFRYFSIKGRYKGGTPGHVPQPENNLVILIEYILPKIASFFSVAPAVIVFSNSGKPTGIVTTAHYLKHPGRWKTARNLVS